MKDFLLLMTLLVPFHLKAQRQPTYYVNGELVLIERVSLINPTNITKIEVVKETEPPEVRITTKEIVFLTYNQLKQRANVEANKQPNIIVDTETIANKENILIDESFIRKINLLRKSGQSSTILVKTKFYKRRIKESKNPSIRIRGVDPSLSVVTEQKTN
jgi:hypothetical protein